MSYSNDEIIKMLDNAVKKIKSSNENVDAEKTEPGDSAIPKKTGSDRQKSADIAASKEMKSIQPDLGGAVISHDIESSPPIPSDPAELRQAPAIYRAGSRPVARQRSATSGTRRTSGKQRSEAVGTGNPSTRERSETPDSESFAASQKSNRDNTVSAAFPVAQSDIERSQDFDNVHDGASPTEPDIEQVTEPDIDIGPVDFKIKFDFDSAYRDVPEEKPLRTRREKRTGCVGGILYAAFVICVSLVLASLAWLGVSDVLGFGTESEQVNITVSSGFTMDAVIDTLYDAGLIKYKWLFRMYADFSNADEKISAGTYVLNKNFDYRSLVYGMTARGGVFVETTVTIPEGFTLAEIFMRLQDEGVCDAADLWEVATNHNFDFDFLDDSTLGNRLRLEGFLFPETYNFFKDSAAEQVLNRFLNEFNRRYTDTYVERAEFMGYSIHEIITIASMIEREAGSDDERSRIAAVIYNRLNNSATFPRLEIDATIGYAIAGTGRPWSLSVDSPYNTYMHPGLPPGPIASPGIESIRAALYPDSTNEFFYALNRQGTHEFFTTFAQHDAFVASPEFGGR